MDKKGKTLKKAIEKSGITITALIKKLKKGKYKISRTKLYHLFKKEHIDDWVLQEIGKVIHFDFLGNKPAPPEAIDPRTSTNLVREYMLFQKKYIRLVNFLVGLAKDTDDPVLKQEILERIG